MFAFAYAYIKWQKQMYVTYAYIFRYVHVKSHAGVALSLHRLWILTTSSLCSANYGRRLAVGRISWFQANDEPSRFLTENQKSSFHQAEGSLVIINNTMLGMCVVQMLLSPPGKYWRYSVKTLTKIARSLEKKILKTILCKTRLMVTWRWNTSSNDQLS